MKENRSTSGIFYAITAAILFGASTPLSKALLGQSAPWMLAGLLYLGSGLGLAAIYSIRKASVEADLKGTDWLWLGGAILAGGIAAPVLMMFGLSHTQSSIASLLLNLEGVFTALIAWFVFKEHFDRRIAVGMGAITAGSVLLSWQGRPDFDGNFGFLAIVAACLAWAIDNNLTRKVSSADPIQIAMLKGCVAGIVNVSIALSIGEKLPHLLAIGEIGLVGFFGYGISLVLFVLALRHIGTARTGAYFAIAPFVGASIAILLFKEPITTNLLIAAGLMSIGVWFHLSEQHSHEHIHAEIEHEHSHIHDLHHQHKHDELIQQPHSHTHQHSVMLHSHPHYPDTHHRHGH